jgi:hypothetical protein
MDDTDAMIGLARLFGASDAAAEQVGWKPRRSPLEQKALDAMKTRTSYSVQKVEIDAR